MEIFGCIVQEMHHISLKAYFSITKIVTLCSGQLSTFIYLLKLNQH